MSSSSLSPFPYLLRPIARLYLIKRSAHDRELLPRFATPDKTLAPGRDNTAGREKKMLALVAMHFASHRMVTAASIYYARYICG